MMSPAKHPIFEAGDAPLLYDQRNILYFALKNLCLLHSDQVFICGKDDEGKVATALAKANRAIDEVERKF